VNEARAKAEKTLGVTGRQVRNIMKEIGVDSIDDLGVLKVREKQVVIALRHVQAEQAREELDAVRRLREGEVISLDFAIQQYAGALAEIRTQLSNTPDRLCAVLRPDDPDGAWAIRWEELGRISDIIAAKIRAL
jgi:hypothetical protein